MPVRKVTFDNPALRAVCNSSRAIDSKIETIKTAVTTGYGKPGPTMLGSHAKHMHLTDKTGIAWEYTDESSVKILALGKKDNSSGKVTSGYKWCQRGKVAGLP